MLAMPMAWTMVRYYTYRDLDCESRDKCDDGTRTRTIASIKGEKVASSVALLSYDPYTGNQQKAGCPRNDGFAKPCPA